MRHIPLTALILVNLVPIAGVLYLGWDVKTILVLYWLENVIAGLYNVVKIMSLRDDARSKTGTSLFFAAHYGLFTAVHGLFVFTMIGENAGPNDNIDFSAIFQDSSLAGSGLFLAIIGLIISHGVSLVINFYGRGEYKVMTQSKQMMMPYQRMIILHITIIIGGAFLDMTGAPIAMLGVLVALKLGMDIIAHLVSHKQAAKMVQIEENPNGGAW